MKGKYLHLRSEIIRAGFTCYNVAEAIGISPQALSQKMNGYSLFSAEEMVYLRKNKACSKSAVPLQFALDYVYQDLKQKHAKYQHIWDKKQRYKWDRQPITNEQIALIHKLAPDYKIDTHKMTRGDASRAIQLLTYKPEEWTPQTTPSEVQDHAKKSP